MIRCATSSPVNRQLLPLGVCRAAQTGLANLWATAGNHRQSRGSPFGKAIFEPPNVEPARPQRRDRFEGQDAVGSATVGDDFLLAIQFAQARRKLRQWNVDCSREMSESELVRGAHIDNSYAS